MRRVRKLIKHVRPVTEGVFTLLTNANFKGFFTGRIYSGPAKSVCVPGLNCYSCPGALGSCPLGSLQNALGQKTFKIPYYVLGLLLFFGALFGRAVCGFLCPFGFIEELVYRIPVKKHNRFRLDRPLRKLKYVILILLVVLPLFVKLTPFFCEYLCPAGTLSGVLLALADTRLFALFGKRFFFKLAILLLVLISSAAVFRPFCKYLCPLGAFYGLFNPVSAVTLRRDKTKCTSCGVCVSACPMGADPVRKPDSAECIRCGLCADACPEEALELGLRARKKEAIHEKSTVS